MRTWHTATHDLRCGGPHADWTVILAGTPVQVITGLGRPRFRCIACADGPVPADAAPRATAASRPAGLTSFRDALGGVLDADALRWA